MAYKNKTICNPKTGQEIRFLQTANDTNGTLLEMEATFSAHSKEPVEHYHPIQHENFEVLEGTLMIRLNSELKILHAGAQLHIPPNTPHSMWNNADKPAKVNWRVQPAMDTEYFLETSLGLAAANKTNDSGMPPLLQVAIMARRFRKVFRLSRPSYFVQSILFSMLAPVACLTGYKAIYKQYID